MSLKECGPVIAYVRNSVPRQPAIESVHHVVIPPQDAVTAYSLSSVIPREFHILLVTMATRLISLTVPFPSPELAELAFDVLSVDKEPKRSQVTREITVQEANLLITFHGPELKWLRVAVNGILKNIILIAKTIEQFKS